MNVKNFYRSGTLAVLFLTILLLSGSASAQTAADADFNGNGEVDIPDFLQFVDAYGSQTGQANYDAKFDLNGNGMVDIPDFLAFVDLYGQTVQDTGSVRVIERHWSLCTMPKMGLSGVTIETGFPMNR